MFSLSPSFSTLYITQKSLSRVSFYFPSPQSHSSQFPARPRSVRCVGAPKYVMSCSLLAQIVSHSTCRNEASRFSAFAASYSNTENFTVQNFDRRAYFLHSVRDTYWHDLRELNLTKFASRISGHAKTLSNKLAVVENHSHFEGL